MKKLSKENFFGFISLFLDNSCSLPLISLRKLKPMTSPQHVLIGDLKIPGVFLKLRLRAKFSYICGIFPCEASTSGSCSRELKRNLKVVYCELEILGHF